MLEKTHSIFKKAGLWVLSALVILLMVLFIIPLLWPFILAFFISLLLERPIEYLRSKFRMKRGFASAFTVTLFLLLFLGICAFVISRLGTSLGEYINDIPEKLGDFTIPSTGLQQRLNRIASSLPMELSGIFQSMLDSVRRQASELPSRIYARLFDTVSTIISKAPNIIFSTVVLALGTYFISAGFPEVKGFLLRQLPKKLRSKAGMIKGDILNTFRGWGIAQLKLMGICFIELSAAFLIMGIEHTILIAAAIAAIDALPVFGIGLALIPWALFSLLTGNYTRALLLILTYAAVNLVRSCLEPRLLGEQFGLHPAATLISVYAGYRLTGVSGMILFPITLMLLKQFNDRGWLKLWK